MSLSSLSTIYSITNYIQSVTAPTYVLAVGSTEKWAMGVNWSGTKYIRTSNGTSSTGTSNTSNESNFKAVNVISSSTNSRLIGSYVFDSNLTIASGNLMNLFGGNTTGHSFTIASGTST